MALPHSYAVKRDHEDTVELLLDRDAVMQPMESNIREPPLCYAAKSNRPRMIMQLLDRGLDINAKDSYGCTALSSAAQMGYYDCVEVLLSRGADRNIKDHDGRTARPHAQQAGYTGVTQLLSG